MNPTLDDSRNRPVVFETRAEQSARRMPRPVRVVAGSTLVLAALTGAVGLALGGSAVWSAVQPQAPANAPAPLWFAPPSHVTKAATEDRTTANEGKADADHKPANSGKGSSSTKGGGKGRSPGGGESSSGGGDTDSSNTVTGSTGTVHTATASTATHAATPTTKGEPEPGDNGHKGGSGGGGGGGGGSASGGGGGSGGGKGGGKPSDD